MVDPVVLGQLDAAVQDAADKRNELQSRVKELRQRLRDASANLTLAQTQDNNAAETARLNSEARRKLLDYYEGEADKSGLEAVLARINKLAREQQAADRLVQEAWETETRCNKEFEEAKTNLAVGKEALQRAQQDWQKIRERTRRAREEP